MINADVGMGESMKKIPLNKELLFRDYVSRYKYTNIEKAIDDFNEIFEILDAINYALQINAFNGHPRNMFPGGRAERDLEEEVTMIFRILCERGVINSYPFEKGDRYVSFAKQMRGD